MSQQVISKRTGLILTSVGVVSTVISVPVNAQTTTEQSSIADVENTVDSIAGIAGAAATVVILAMGVRLAIKQVNRVMTKG